MKTLVAIPSKGRPYDIQRYVLKWIRGISHDYVFFIEPGERIHYSLVLSDHEMFILPKDNQGLGYSFQHIGIYAKERGYDLVFMLNDDYGGMVSKYVNEGATKVSDKVCDFIIDDVEPDFEATNTLAAVMISKVMNHYFEFNGKARKYTHINQVLFHGWIIRPEYLEKYMNEKMEHNQYTALSLYVWRDGNHTLRYGKAGINFMDAKNKGGCQCFDRKQQTLNTYEYLKRDFPLIEVKPIDRWYEIDIQIDEYLCRNSL